MSVNSKIEWTDATFNPWWGCTKVSIGCAHCYAETFSKRYGHNIWGRGAGRRFFGKKHWVEPLKWNEAAKKFGQTFRVFCGSMCDVFEDRTDLLDERRRLFNLIDETKHLTWMLLTKRPENMLSMVPPDWDNGWPINVWAMTSVENQNQANKRIPELLKIPVGIKGLSIEPLLEPIVLPISTWKTLIFSAQDQPKLVGEINWCIVGGESGPGSRPFNIQWARDLKEQCRARRVPFFMKQMGTMPHDGSEYLCLKDRKGGDWSEWPEDLRIREFP